jgi:phage terminase large subunit-like protein
VSGRSRFYQYVDDVIDGKVVVGKYTRLAVERFIKDLERKEYIFDYKTGERIVTFSEKYCRHWKGIYANKPVTLLNHQIFNLVNIFGWKNQDGTRRFKRTYKEIARKNGKTTESAVKGLYLISKDGEIGAQIYAVATKEDQANIVVNDAGKIVEASPALRGKFDLYRYKEFYKRVIFSPTSSFIKPLGKDSKRQDGLDPSTGIIDEYHAFNDDELINVLQSGMGMRAQSLIDIITTAGFNQAGPCYAFRKVCTDVLEGVKVDDALFAMIFCLDDTDDWRDPETWIKANPNMSDPVLRDKLIMPSLKQRYHEVINEGGAKEVDFKTKNLNIWCDAPTVWIPSYIWDRNTHGIKVEELEGAMCWGGLDLSSGIDLNSFALFFPQFRGDINVILSYNWIPEDNVKRNSIKMDYTRWVNEGSIMTTPGNIIDHQEIAAFIDNTINKYSFQTLGFDAHMSYHGMIQTLINASIDCQPIGQGMLSITEPTKEFEKMIYAGKIEHFNNPVLKWMNSSAVIKIDQAGNYMMDKGKTQGNSGKIDGLAAAVNAIAAWQRFPPTSSVYSTRGVIVFD